MFESIVQRLKSINHSLTSTDVHPEPMRICMLGSRGVGKTSVITSMYQSHRQVVEGTNLYLIPDGDTSVMLNSKLTDLKMIFPQQCSKDTRVSESGIAGDASETTFSFTYGLNSEKINIGMEITDYPGEYVQAEPERVASYISKADAIFIAIDTPCMMECDGAYCGGKNRPQLISDFLITHLGHESQKLVLFVPIKCEKYYQENRIDEVTARIETLYAPLIAFLRDRQDEHGMKNKICCAITPIRTLGNVVFDAFETDAAGKVIELRTPSGLPIPRKAFYKFSTTDATYQPLDCAQPLYYLLSFFAKQYTEARDKAQSNSYLFRLKSMLRMIPRADLFLNEVSRLAQNRCENRNGYKVLFGKGRL